MLIKWLRKFFSKTPEPVAAARKRPVFLSTEVSQNVKRAFTLTDIADRAFQRTVSDDAVVGSAIAMDGAVAMDGVESLKVKFLSDRQGINELQLDWYTSQGFIGHQTCALVAQQWLVDKACTMPAEDAVRNGYELTVNDGMKISPDILDAVRKTDDKYKLTENLVQFVRMNRVFGIRIAVFKVEPKLVSREEYYLRPFNADGIEPGSYKGIAQIDPYWITPELDIDAASNPLSIHFYEPTWWRVSGMRIHRTHLVIIRNSEVPDVLKPTYFYGGIPLPQKICERVYASERTADEGPLLALTKRLVVRNTDLTKAIANQGQLEQQLQLGVTYRDNYGVLVADTDEVITQHDTSLADLDTVIMTQYQLVAAIAEVPAVKLLGTSPKGFNTTGEHEEKNYHEMLKSLQTHKLTPLLERHYMLVIRSEIVNLLAPDVFTVKPKWHTLAELTAKEQAEVNKMNAETGKVLFESGAIDGQDERSRIIADPNSGYNGLPLEKPLDEEDDLLNDDLLELDNAELALEQKAGEVGTIA